MGQGPSAKSKVPNKYFTRTECRNILTYCISRADGFAGEGPRLAYFSFECYPEVRSTPDKPSNV